jgi:hypothetical protein
MLRIVVAASCRLMNQLGLTKGSELGLFRSREINKERWTYKGHLESLAKIDHARHAC